MTSVDFKIETIKENLQKPVVMIGLMGAGKTRIGSMLAKALDLPFVDADQEIEAAAGLTISEIFEQHGEPFFRDMERKIIARLLSDELKVIATGGGAVMNQSTAELVWNKSYSVWLSADLDVLVERTSRNTKRPLLQNGDARDILSKLMDKRYPVYANANIMVETDAEDMEHTLNNLLIALSAYLEEQEDASHD